MNRLTLSFIPILTLVAVASADSLQSGDFNGDGVPETLIFHAESGNVSLDQPVILGRATTPPSVADINQNGLDDIAVASFSENRVLLAESQRNGAAEVSEFPIPGPVGAAFADVVRGGDLELVTFSTAGDDGNALVWWDLNQRVKVPTVHALGDITLKHGYISSMDVFEFGGVLQALGTASASDGEEHHYYTISLVNATIASVNTAELDHPYTRTTAAAVLDGKGSTVLWDPGHSTVAIGLLLPAVQQIEASSSAGYPIGDVAIIPEGAGHKLLIVSFDGKLAKLFDYVGGQLVEQQSFSPPAGEVFSSAQALSDGSIQFALKNEGEVLSQLIDYQNDGGVYSFKGKVSPLSKLLSEKAKTTVVAYTKNPLLHADALEIERFAKGKWATAASLQVGGIEAFTETFGSTLTGLSNSVVTNFNPVNPAVGAVANQYEDDSSICHLGGAGFSGDAAVTISPPPGIFTASTAVSFLPATKNTSVVYRTNGADWKQWNSPIFLTQSTTIEFYGQHSSGLLSPIQSALYEIDQSLQFADSNDDGLPDSIASALGLAPLGDGDSDGDGFSDLDEILKGTSPADPESLPAESALRSTVQFRVLGADSSSPLANPGGQVSIYRLDGSFVASGLVGRSGIATLEIKLGSIDGVGIAFYEQSLGDRGMLQMATGVIGHGAPPLPAGDLSTERWVQEAKTIIGGFKSMSGMSSDTEIVEISPQSTLGVLAFEAWLADALLESGAIEKMVDAPRLVPPSSWFIPEVEDEVLVVFAKNGQSTVAHELGHVIQQMDAASKNNGRTEWHRGLTILYTNLRASPLLALSRLFFENEIPASYGNVLDVSTSRLAAEKATIVGSSPGQSPITIVGTLGIVDSNCIVLTTGDGTTYSLAQGDGSRYWPTAPIIKGSTATASGLPLSDQSNCADHDFHVLTLSVVVLAIGGLTDTDGDGVDDTYEEAFHGTLSFGATDDPDGDGITLGQSFAAGAPPAGEGGNGNPPTAEPLQVVVSRGDTWNQLVLSWVTSPDQAFEVNVSTDMTIWRSSGGNVEESRSGFYQWRTNLNPQLVLFQFFQVVEQ
ncbi:MAG: hypothetical protein ACI9R3_002660 [Verrucomicrobiales bacterium]|jgi:hypothetical protein